MQNLPFKNSALFKDKKNRVLFHDYEILFSIFLIFKQSKFSPVSNFSPFFIKSNLNRPFFSLLRDRCILSGYNRTVSTKIKFSRFSFTQKTLQASNCGFYRSVW